MGDQPLLLGLDLGTSRLKAVLVDGEGIEVATSAVATPFRPRGEQVDMEVECLWDGLGRAILGLGGARRQVTAVGVAGMAESGTVLDAHGRALAPVIAWHDPRGAGAVRALEARFGDELSRRIGQRLRTVSSVAKLGWLVVHGVERVHRWLGVPELCVFALTGAQFTDHSLAARTGCYDITSRRWWPEVPEAIDVPATVLPEVAAAGAVLGRTSAAALGAAGLPTGLLPTGVPVTLAGHDHLAALAGSGAGPGDHGNSVGTAETVVAASDALPDLDLALARRVAVTVDPRGEGWVVLAGAARAGRVLEVLSEALGAPPAELDALAERAGTVDARALVDACALVDGVARGGRPALPPAAPGALWGGVLRALSERTWDAVVRAGAVVGPASRLVVFGGGSRSRTWLAAKAQVGAEQAAGMPVWRSGAGEAAARGAALFAGMAAGWWPTPDAAPAPALEEVLVPPPVEAPTVPAGTGPRARSGREADARGDGPDGRLQEGRP
ncbi:MAG: FGGY family carbohydrate kinase [Actinomycetota bacterium]|jgi:xylulokinase|nr:FGGY family carbohydrate kinase [Actinomycetota bacterium]